MKSQLNFLKHILAESVYLRDESTKISQGLFLENQTLKRAFVRSIEIIGEATKNIDNDFRNQYPKVDWKKMAGMRDKLIHGYFDIDYQIVWDIVKNKIPELIKNIEEILSKER